MQRRNRELFPGFGDYLASETAKERSSMARTLRHISPIFVLLSLSATALADTGGGDPQIVFNNSCRTCHSINEGDHRLGPSLHGVVGRKAGSIEGYAFSSAMKSSDIVWTEENLDQFIASPDKVVHGNAMKPYGGIDDPEQRAEIVAYLKTISD
jgi:cytochrome c